MPIIKLPPLPSQRPDLSWGFNWEFVVKDTYFNWIVLYKWLHNFLMVEGWVDLQTQSDRYETFLQEIDMGEGAKNQWVYWRAVKNLKESGGEYMKLFFALNVQVLFSKKIEVMHKGRKVKLDTGEFKFVGRVYFSQELDKDGEKGGSLWNSNKFFGLFRFLKKRFWRRLNQRIYNAAKVETSKESDKIYYALQKYTGALPDDDVKGFWMKDKGAEF
ncbi:MAG: hypothetical protein AB7V77_03035 [Candidatus Woesearchaeota archaeon]